MMIVDSSILITCLEKNDFPDNLEMIVPDDLYEEYLAAEIRHNQKIKNIRLASTIDGYNEAIYLRKYSEALNGYSQVSFDKMRGLGDVSIIALVACLVTGFGKSLPQTSLNFGTDNSNTVTIVTNDDKLKRKLKKDFDKFIKIIGYEEFIKL